MSKSDFDDLAADAVDLDPVADANAVAPHQHEPAEEGDDEIFHRDRQAGAGQAEHRRRLCGHAEDDEQNHQRAHGLHRELHHRRSVSMRLFSAVMPVNRWSITRRRQVDQEQHQQDPEQRLDHVVQGRALAGLDQRDPVAVDVAEVLLVLQAAAAVGEIFLIERVLLQRIERRFGGGL